MHKVKVIIVEQEFLEDLESEIEYFLEGKTLVPPISIIPISRYDHPPEVMAIITYLEDGTGEN